MVDDEMVTIPEEIRDVAFVSHRKWEQRLASKGDPFNGELEVNVVVVIKDLNVSHGVDALDLNSGETGRKIRTEIRADLTQIVGVV
jgi:hypothetical protein